MLLFSWFYQGWKAQEVDNYWKGTHEKLKEYSGKIIIGKKLVFHLI